MRQRLGSGRDPVLIDGEDTILARHGRVAAAKLLRMETVPCLRLELERRQRLGVTGPEPLPHPDHVILDLRAGTVQIRGPATKERAEWDLWVERKRMFEEELEELEALSKDPKCRQKRIVLKEIERTKKVLEFIRRAVG